MKRLVSLLIIATLIMSCFAYAGGPPGPVRWKKVSGMLLNNSADSLGFVAGDDTLWFNGARLQFVERATIAADTTLGIDSLIRLTYKDTLGFQSSVAGGTIKLRMGASGSLGIYAGETLLWSISSDGTFSGQNTPDILSVGRLLSDSADFIGDLKVNSLDTDTGYIYFGAYSDPHYGSIRLKQADTIRVSPQILDQTFRFNQPLRTPYVATDSIYTPNTGQFIKDFEGAGLSIVAGVLTSSGSTDSALVVQYAGGTYIPLNPAVGDSILADLDFSQHNLLDINKVTTDSIGGVINITMGAAAQIEGLDTLRMPDGRIIGADYVDADTITANQITMTNGLIDGVDKITADSVVVGGVVIKDFAGTNLTITAGVLNANPASANWATLNDQDSIVYVGSDTLIRIYLTSGGDVALNSPAGAAFNIWETIDLTDGTGIIQGALQINGVSGSDLTVAAASGNNLRLNYNNPDKVAIYSSTTEKWYFDTDSLVGVAGTVIKGAEWAGVTIATATHSDSTNAIADGGVDFADIGANGASALEGLYYTGSVWASEFPSWIKRTNTRDTLYALAENLSDYVQFVYNAGPPEVWLMEASGTGLTLREDSIVLRTDYLDITGKDSTQHAYFDTDTLNFPVGGVIKGASINGMFSVAATADTAYFIDGANELMVYHDGTDWVIDGGGSGIVSFDSLYIPTDAGAGTDSNYIRFDTLKVDVHDLDSLIGQKGRYAAGAGDITGVTAGNGLTGGGASGDVTLTVQASDGSIIVGAGGISTSLGTSVTLSSEVTGTLPVANGGTGTATLTDGGMLVGSGTGAVTALGVATNGQIPIGDGTTDPVLGTIAGGTGLTVTNGTGTISIAHDAHTGDVTGSTVLTIGINAVDDTHIDWGTAAGQVSADDVPDGSTNATPTLVQETNWDLAYGWGDHSLAGYLGIAAVTYENLDANLDVGTSAGQLSIGNHAHTGTYLPLSGGTMGGNIDLGSNNLTSVGAIETTSGNSWFRNTAGGSAVWLQAGGATSDIELIFSQYLTTGTDSAWTMGFDQTDGSFQLVEDIGFGFNIAMKSQFGTQKTSFPAGAYESDYTAGEKYQTSTEVAAGYQPLEATLTDIADGTIAENLVNTANPWADNEVADDITASSYLPLAGGTMSAAIDLGANGIANGYAYLNYSTITTTHPTPRARLYMTSTYTGRTDSSSMILIDVDTSGVAQIILDGINGDAAGSDYATISQKNDGTLDINLGTSTATKADHTQTISLSLAGQTEIYLKPDSFVVHPPFYADSVLYVDSIQPRTGTTVHIGAPSGLATFTDSTVFQVDKTWIGSISDGTLVGTNAMIVDTINDLCKATNSLGDSSIAYSREDIEFTTVHGAEADAGDSIYLHLPYHAGDTAWLFRCSTAVDNKTTWVTLSMMAPYDIDVDSIAFGFQASSATAADIDSVEFWVNGTQEDNDLTDYVAATTPTVTGWELTSTVNVLRRDRLQFRIYLNFGTAPQWFDLMYATITGVKP